MEQKKLKTFREKLIAEEAGDPGGLQQEQDLRQGSRRGGRAGHRGQGRATPTPRSSSSACRTTSATCCSSWTRPSHRIEDRALRRLRGLRGRDGPQAAGGGALGQALHLLPGEAGAGPAVSRGSRAWRLPRASARAWSIPCWRSSSPRAARPARAPLDHPTPRAALRARAGRRCRATAAPLCALRRAARRAGLPACGRCRRGLSPVRARAPASAPTRARCASPSTS